MSLLVSSAARSAELSPFTTPSPKLAIANNYATGYGSEQRELRGPSADSTFESVIPPARLQARLAESVNRSYARGA